MKAQHNIERFVIIQRLKCGSFKLNKDDGNAAHAWDYYTPIAGGRYTHSVGYCLLSFSRSFHNLSLGNKQ